MNVICENINELNATVKIKLTAEDYLEKVDKNLKDYQKKAQVPGFRPGKVPFGMIKKMYGKAVLFDEVNKILVDELYKYIEENKIEVLGNPLPNENSVNFEIIEGQDVEYYWDLGISPKVDIKIDNKLKADFYQISVPQNIIDNYIKGMRERYGKQTEAEISEDDDLLYGELIQLDENNKPLENGITRETSIFPRYFSNDEAKKDFVGLKISDTITFNPLIASGSIAETSSMLGISREEAEKINSNFSFTVKKISRNIPAEMNIDFYKNTYPEAEINTEEEFILKVKNEASKMYENESNRKFFNDIIELLIENNKFELPEEFLKRWLLATNKEKFTAEQIDSEFNSFTDALRWQIIEKSLLKDHNIEVGEKEVNDYIKGVMKNQLAMYGQSEPSEDLMNGLVQRIKNNKEEMKRVYDKLYDDKLIELFKNSLTINNIEISYEDFAKLVAEKKN